MAELAQQSAQQLQALRTSLSQFLASLGVTQLGGGSPESRYLAARAQFETTSAAARGGDQAAIAQIQDVITALLETSAAYNASGDGFVADRAAVEAVLLELIAAGQPGSGAPGAPAATDPAAAAQEQLQTALANLATAQDLVAQTGASTALSAQSLLEQYVATSAAQQAAQNAHTALLAQTAGVDLQQLQQGATVASLLAELAAGEVERLQVQQELAIAQDVATQIGAQTAQVQRDLLAEFVAAEAERSTAAAAYQLLLEQTAGIDLSVLEQTVAMTGLLEQLAAYEADKAIAQARLTSAQEVANTVGAGAVTAVRDLVAEFIAASAERDQALADYNLALDQTKDVNFAVLNNQQTIAQLLANLDSAYTELGTARQGLLDAQAVATAVGANATNTVRDLVAEFNAAQAEHTAALARHNEALEQTKDINFAMLDNQASLADLLGNLNTAATNLDLARVSLTAAEEALATAITNTATTAAAAGSDLVAGVYANVLGRTGSMAPTSGELNYWTTALAGTNGQETGVTSQNLVQRMVADAFQFEGDPVYGYVVDLLRAQGYKADGSHADGLANVPWDGYRALLHRGERVMTARDNEVFSSFNWDSWSRSMGGGGDPRMAAEVEGLRGDVRRLEAALEASGNHQAAVAADGHLETHRLLGSLVTATDEAPRRLARVLVGAR